MGVSFLFCGVIIEADVDDGDYLLYHRGTATNRSSGFLYLPSFSYVLMYVY